MRATFSIPDHLRPTLLAVAARTGYREHARVIADALEFHLHANDARQGNLGVLVELRGAWTPAACERRRWLFRYSHWGEREDGLTFHDTRRTAARNMRRAGVDETVAMAITGHRTASMFRRYATTDADDIRDAVIRTAAYVAEQPKTRKIVAGAF